MKELLLIAAAVVIAMGIVAASVVVGRDTTTLVSPPEAVAEEFIRQLAAGRDDRALEHLAEPSGAHAKVEADGRMLRTRAGAVNLVAGEAGAITGDTATASARIQTSNAGELRWTFTFERQPGVWKISEYRSD